MKRLTNHSLTIILFLILFVSASSQAGAELFGLVTPISKRTVPTTTFLEGPSGETSLYSIDPETGQGTEIGGTGYTACSGLDFEPVTNDLYGVCSKIEDIPNPRFVEGEGGQVLVKIDRTTGQAEEIGPVFEEFERSSFVTDISFDSDGVLFAHVRKFGLKEIV